jgi:hypothetical protein
VAPERTAPQQRKPPRLCRRPYSESPLEAGSSTSTAFSQSQDSTFTRIWQSRSHSEMPPPKASASGTKQTCSMRRRMSASGGKTDVDQPLLTNLDL